MQLSRLLPALVTLSLVACAAPEHSASLATGDKRPLTLDDVSDPSKRLDFDGDVMRGLVWLDAERFLWRAPDEGQSGKVWVAVDARSGASAPYLDAARFAAALAALEGIDAEEAARLTRRGLNWSEDKSSVLVEHEGDLILWTVGSDTARRLTHSEAEEELAELSPDATKVAFVREHDLFVLDVASGDERRLSEGGGENRYNGILDWLYQEELYGRGNFKGFWWSPDSKRIAWLSLDESDVPRYTVVDDRPTPPKLRVFPYPKAGDPNPKVSLSITEVADGVARAVDLASFAESEPLVVRVHWSPAGDVLAFQVQDREQRWLELCFADPASGAWRRVLRETTPAWVDVQGAPRWLADGSFLWLSERDGWKHVWRYAADGTEIARLTSGAWEVGDIEAVDERADDEGGGEGWVWFTATKANPIGADVFRVRLDGSGLEQLTDGKGTHSPSFSPDHALFLDSWSSLESPPKVFLDLASGRRVRTVDANPVPLLDELALQPLERYRVPTRDGFEMQALLIKPAGFDTDERYPVYQHLYAGPHAPTVRDRWQGRRGMFWQLLAQEGVAVWICDNRSASGAGAVSSWPVYERLVETELADIEDGLDWLKQKRWVDPERIGVHGWSFGGLMTCYALTHSKSFAMGIAGGSVTDWRNYDTIYTERFMRQPKNNPEGYERTAPRLAAADLHGELLLIHGTMDDNVHPQNTLQFAWELQKAGRLFELMFYPGSAHAVVDPALAHHLNATMLDFIRRTLLGECPRAKP